MAGVKLGSFEVRWGRDKQIARICPFCNGAKKLNKKICPRCEGLGKVCE